MFSFRGKRELKKKRTCRGGITLNACRPHCEAVILSSLNQEITVIILWIQGKIVVIFHGMKQNTYEMAIRNFVVMYVLTEVN